MLGAVAAALQHPGAVLAGGVGALGSSSGPVHMWFLLGGGFLQGPVNQHLNK